MKQFSKVLFFCLLAAKAWPADIVFDEGELGASAHSAALVQQALQKGTSVVLDLKRGPAILRGEGRRWTPQGLEAVISYRGAYKGGADVPAQGSWLNRDTVPRILLIENNSSVSPLSKSLSTWRWPLQVTSFEQVEQAPKIWLDPLTYDAVVFSSPGWWQSFANPPSGPSRIPDGVAAAARAFVSGGGTAVFFDIAQWDLEKIWPKSLRLSSLGPYEISSFNAAGEASGGKLELAPFGVVAQKVENKSAARLFYQEAFAYPDGSQGLAEAGYAFPDPNQGSGFVAAFAFHPFEQDESLAGLSRRMVLNILLASGSNHISVSRDSAAAAPTRTPEPTVEEELTFPPSFTPTPQPKVPTASPSPAATFSPLPSLTWTLTLEPTRLPTAVPTRPPLALPTLAPTPWPTRAPTAVPTALPLATLAPTPLPTRQPAAVPSVSAPKELQVMLPTLQPTPEPWPTAKPRLNNTPQAAIALRRPPAAARIHDALGCLQSSPEPFSEGGVYVFFCLKHSASVRLKVFSVKGLELYCGATRFLPPGSHQEFYSGVDAKGAGLKPGRYRYRIEAQYDGQNAEWRQGDFNLRRKNR